MRVEHDVVAFFSFSNLLFLKDEKQDPFAKHFEVFGAEFLDLLCDREAQSTHQVHQFVR
jgi:hypothetical protein